MILFLPLISLVRPEGFEPAAYGFEDDLCDLGFNIFSNLSWGGCIKFSALCNLSATIFHVLQSGDSPLLTC
jgi:hypothetical protein